MLETNAVGPGDFITDLEDVNTRPFTSDEVCIEFVKVGMILMGKSTKKYYTTVEYMSGSKDDGRERILQTIFLHCEIYWCPGGSI